MNSTRTRTFSLAAAVAVWALCWCGHRSLGDTVPSPTMDLPANASIDQVLDALHDQGRDLKSFTADVHLREVDTTMDSSLTRSGTIWFEIKPDGQGKMHLIFDQKEENKRIKKEKKEYLLEDGWLTDRDYHAENETRRQVARPNQKLDLFQLGKGAFPLPIGQKKADVLQSFDVTKPDSAKDDPAGTIHLRLVPKPGSSLARQFATIDVWVDEKLKMPVRIRTEDTDHAKVKTTDLQNLKTNDPLDPAVFKLADVASSWTKVSIPIADNPR